MNLLVLGKSGQVAQSLRNVARGKGCQIHAHGRPDVDLTNPPSIKAAIENTRPDIVVNAAAYTAVDQAETDQASAFAVNAAGAEHVANLCAEAQCPLIHVSTDYVFDGTSTHPYQENDTTRPLGVYGQSKLQGEHSITSCLEQHIILRTAWVYSPFGSNFVKTMLRLARDRNEVSVVNDQLGSPTYAPHLAHAILAIADHIGMHTDVAWGVYHAAGTGNATWFELAKEVFSVSKTLGGPTADVLPISTEDYPTPAQRPKNSQLNCMRLKTTFSLSLPQWQDGVRDCVKQLINQTHIIDNQQTNGSLS